MPALKSARGNVSEGPQRWVRARENAEARPTSGGAKLYRKRAHVAAQLKQAFFAHQQQAFTVLRGTGIRHQDVRRINVCSLECLGFQMQLEVGERPGQRVGIVQYETLVASALNAKGDIATYTWVPEPARSDWTRSLVIATLDKSTLPRPVTCRVCGTKMVGDKQTVAAIADFTKSTTQYVLVNGELVRVEDLMVVDLTSRDHELLDGYSTPDLRAQYVSTFGRRFNA